MNTFKVGDKVTVTRRGCIGAETRDWTNYTEGNILLDNVEYTISKVHQDSESRVSIVEQRLKYGIHPDHFTKVN